MARISLLLSLAFALIVASAFAHEAPSGSASASASASASSSISVTGGKYSSPCTVGQLKTLPFVEITKMINAKWGSSSKTPALVPFFSVCKEYTSFLASFSKRADFEFSFHGPASMIWKTKFMAMKQALFASQMGFGMDGKAALKFKKNYEGMIHGFSAIPSKIAEISSRHQFSAGAKLSAQEQKEFTAVFESFKKCFTGYFDGLAKFAAKKHVAVEGKSGGHFGGEMGKNIIGNFFGIGGKGEFSASASGKVDANGKKKKKAHHKRRSLFAGEDGFRSLNSPQEKYLVGLKA